MELAAFCEWLHSLHAVIIDDGRSCAKQQSWLLQTGALVTHAPQPGQAIELVRARAHDLDVLLIDADAHPSWLSIVEQVPPACGALIVSTEPDIGMLRAVMEHGAGYISRDAPAHDFIFSVYNLSIGRAPHLERLAARAARLWGLSPQLSRLLHYNLWGYSDRDIADALSISLKTAQQYQDELRRRTGVKTKHAYLRRLLMLAGREPLLPVTDHTSVRIAYDRARLLAMRPIRYQS